MVTMVYNIYNAKRAYNLSEKGLANAQKNADIQKAQARELAKTQLRRSALEVAKKMMELRGARKKHSSLARRAHSYGEANQSIESLKPSSSAGGPKKTGGIV